MRGNLVPLRPKDLDKLSLSSNDGGKQCNRRSDGPTSAAEKQVDARELPTSKARSGLTSEFYSSQRRLSVQNLGLV